MFIATKVWMSLSKFWYQPDQQSAGLPTLRGWYLSCLKWRVSSGGASVGGEDVLPGGETEESGGVSMGVIDVSSNAMSLISWSGVGSGSGSDILKISWS